ncbi:hypothetical protein L484_023995 [Morus notabilis]|uniref:Uncharacterized protein n=1 Tax=Morus notabilis TaxID=981085 RepID=W9RB54_9ROSA|nr:hypothetical protein L484_023995 [Morus notabilis]
MALLRNDTVLLGHETNVGAHPWASCNSSRVGGLWLNPFPISINPSNDAVSRRGRRCRSKPWPSVSIRSLFDKRTPKAMANAERHEQQKRQEVEEEEEDYRVLTSVRSSYNDIMILDTADSRIMCIAFFTSIRNGLIPTGYELLAFSPFLFVQYMWNGYG